MGSRLEMQAVSQEGERQGRGKALSNSWQLGVKRGSKIGAKQHPPLSSSAGSQEAVVIQITAWPGSVCLGSPGAGLRVVFCKQKWQPGAPEPAHGVVCLAFCGLLPLWSQMAPGRDVPHPALSPSSVH